MCRDIFNFNIYFTPSRLTCRWKISFNEHKVPDVQSFAACVQARHALKPAINNYLKTPRRPCCADDNDASHTKAQREWQAFMRPNKLKTTKKSGLIMIIIKMIFQKRR